MQKPQSSGCARVLYRIIWIAFLSSLSLLSYFVMTRLGIGSVFPSQRLDDMPPVVSETELQIVAELDTPPGNIAVSKNGRVFFNFHPEYKPNPIKIAELKNRTAWAPFPNLEFQNQIVTCLSMRIDSKDRLWLLDFAQHGLSGTPKLFGFRLDQAATDQMNTIISYDFPANVAGVGSMLNDFVVDPTAKYIYIADTSIVAATPALVVFSIDDRRSYRILSSHPSMFGRPFLFKVGGVPLHLGPLAAKIHVDSIALDRTGAVLYFGAVTDHNLFSVRTASLLRAAGMSDGGAEDEAEVGVLLETAEKPVTDGLSTDAAGNVWLTAFARSALAVAVPVADGGAAQRARVVKVVESEALLRWPDGLSFGPDGLYVTNSALHLHLHSAVTGADLRARHGPFHILRLPTKAVQAVASALGQPPSAILPPAGQ